MRKPVISEADAERMKAEFFARGGRVNVLPAKGVRRETLKPEIVKKRDLLASLRDRAKGAQNA